MSTKANPAIVDEVESLVRARTAQLLRSNEALREEIEQLRKENAELRRRLAETQRDSLADLEFRRAALNLMEDAVAARRAEQRENLER
jgi:hypothetical protein